jgi:hypothetical protein
MEGKKVIIKELTIKDIILNESKNGWPIFKLPSKSVLFIAVIYIIYKYK